jgi:hypothetical protein
MKSKHKSAKKPAASIMEKPFLEAAQVHELSEASHEHTIFGVHAHDQSHVNRLKHTDPELWNRIRSWN